MNLPIPPCDDLPAGPCAQMGALALGLFFCVGAGLSEPVLLFWMQAPPAWLVLALAWLGSLGAGAWLGLRARADLLAGRSLGGLVLFFGAGGALVALLSTGSLVRTLAWGLAFGLGAAWACYGVRRISMTC